MQSSCLELGTAYYSVVTSLLPPASASAASLKLGSRERLARLVNPPRLNGLDIARGLAILGMVLALRARRQKAVQVQQSAAIRHPTD